MHHDGIEEFEKGLAKKTAELHAEAVLDYLESLDCPVEQKIAMLDAVMDQYR